MRQSIVITSLLFVFCVIVCNVMPTVRADQIINATSCCPVGWSLIKIDEGFQSAHRYDCLNSSSVAGSSIGNVEILGEIEPIYGYRVPESNASQISNIPQCKHQKFLYITGEDDIKLNRNSCLAKIVNKIAAIYCPLDDGNQMQHVSFIHKCCPQKYVYDEVQRKCVIGVTDYVLYEKFFRHTTISVSYNPTIDCPRDKSLVEYRLTADAFSFDGGYFRLNATPHKTFKSTDYCIEAVTSSINRMSDNINGSAPYRQTGEFLVRVCDDVEICSHIACIRKCCSDGEIFSKGNRTSYCQKDESDISFHSFESLQISGNFSKPSVFGILRSLDCRKYQLNPESYEDEAHTISSRDGSLHELITLRNYTNREYCIEKIHNSTSPDQKLYTFLCFDTQVVGNDKIRFKMYPIGLLISCCFYAMTLFVYLSISKLRNLPGKILICLVCSLFAAYLSIALGQLMPTSNDDICFASGFFVYFCLMAAFAWMNVMCFDIWQTFGSTQNRHGPNNDEMKKFLFYSLYGWGLPTLMTTTTVSLTKSNLLSENLRPHFGQGRCWFTYDVFASANLLFFSGPVGLLFLINFVLFSLTLKYCNKVKREIFRMQSSNMEKPVMRRRFFMEKARFAMNTKLFIVMGITWLLEILSIMLYDHKRTFFWAISDSFNVLLGVFVFFIFVFKKRVWHLILEKFGIRSKEQLKNTRGTHSSYVQSMSTTRLNAIDGNFSLLSSNPNGSSAISRPSSSATARLSSL